MVFGTSASYTARERENITDLNNGKKNLPSLLREAARGTLFVVL